MSWEKVRLGDIATFVNGYPFKPSEWSESGLEIIRIQNLTKSGSDTNFFNGSIADKYRVVSGDILISWSATLDIFVWEGREAILNQHIFKVVFDKIEINKNYFIYAIKNILGDMRKQVHGATMQHITKGKFDNLEIPLPPLATQKRIAEILDAADALRRKDQELLKKYDELAQAIFIDMFGDPVTNHKKWTIKPLSEICIKITDGTHHTPMYVSSGIPFLRVTDITESNMSRKYITEEEHLELIKRCKPEKGDVLYTKNGTIGVAKAIDWDFEFSIFVSLCLLKINKELILPEFLEAYLNTPIALKQAKKHSKTGTITNLHLIEIKQILSPVPPISIQKEYLELIDKIKSSINKVNGNNDLLFNSLLQKAFKGELVA